MIFHSSFKKPPTRAQLTRAFYLPLGIFLMPFPASPENPQPGSSLLEQMVYKNLGHAHMIENRTPVSNIPCNNYMNNWSEWWPRNRPGLPLLHSRPVSGDLTSCSHRLMQPHLWAHRHWFQCGSPQIQVLQEAHVLLNKHLPIKTIFKVKIKNIKNIKTALWSPFYYYMTNTRFFQVPLTNKLPEPAVVTQTEKGHIYLTDKHWIFTALFKDNKAIRSRDL